MSVMADRSLPTVQELLGAVNSNAAPSPTIRAVFVSSRDITRDQSSQSVDSRIADARRIFEIVTGKKPPFAVLYKLNDPEQATTKAKDVFYRVLGKASISLEKCMEVIDFLIDESDDPIKKRVGIEMKSTIENRIHKSSATEAEIRALFITAEEEAQLKLNPLFEPTYFKQLTNAAVDSFFMLPYQAIKDHVNAKKEGVIYDPGSNDLHNWGVNAVWTAALAARKTPISILSPLHSQSGVHSRTVFTPGSSAFALEIAIAIKMGYTLNFSPPDAKAKLLPPDKPNLSITLPTRAEQEQIYTWCCSKRMEATTQFDDSTNTSTLHDITYSYAAPSISLSSAASSTKAEAPHTPGPSMLHQFNLECSKTKTTKDTSSDALDSKTNNQKPPTPPSTDSSFKPHH